MKKLVFLFVFLSFVTLHSQDTADVEYTFTITDEFNNSQDLIIGKDPFGSDGLDPEFGEVVVPQVPVGQFGARLMFVPNLGITAIKDIRFGCYWADGYTHLIWLRYINDSSQVTIDWDWNISNPSFLMNIGFFEAISGNLIQYFSYYSDSSYFSVPQGLEFLQMEITYNGTLSWEEYKLLTPNGGDTLHVGDTYNISWWSNQLSPFLNLELSTDVGITWSAIATNISTSQTNFLWTVPNQISNTCFIRVGNFPCKYDVSDNFFVITYPLPVELLSFSSSVSENAITLNWTTATETNNSGFQIERNTPLNPLSRGEVEGRGVWEKIGFVDGNGTTTETKSYSFKDENLSSGTYQYRLKQIDFDGTFEYSNIVEAEILPPAKFSLEQNFPNPFNPSTSIQYSIASRQFVSLKIFDLLGREIVALVDEEQSAGNYTIEFKPESSIKNLVSGVYLYQLKAGEFTQTRKMILLK
jgi:hypothetical protein